MPTYDYKCQKCSHKFEGVAKMNDPCPPCPNILRSADQEDTDGSYECGGETTKVFTAAPVHFHGGGWASDGYSSKK